MGYDGKTALVTGTDSRGMGRAIALKLAKSGCDVALHWFRDRDMVEELAAEIAALGRRTMILYADLGSSTAARETVQGAIVGLGGLDILVCNASKIQRKPFLEVSDEEFSSMIDVNLHGYFACGQEAARHMVDTSRAGRIIMISSVNQAHAGPGISHYIATKGGVMMLARAMALELASAGITVNLVAPGTIETDINRQMLKDPQYRAEKTALVPIGRLGVPEDIAAAVNYLASDEASFVTGSTIVVDGGLTIP